MPCLYPTVLDAAWHECKGLSSKALEALSNCVVNRLYWKEPGRAAPYFPGPCISLLGRPYQSTTGCWAAYTREIKFLTVLEASSSRSASQQDGFFLRPLPWACRRLPSLCVCSHAATPLCMYMSISSSPLLIRTPVRLH